MAKTTDDTLKIGYVDLAKLMREAPQSLVAREELTQEFTPLATSIKESTEKQKQALQQKFTDPANQSDVKQGRALQVMLVGQVKRAWQQYGKRYQHRRREETRKVAAPIMEAISMVAEREGFDIVLTQGVAYAKDSLNITSDVLLALGKTP